MRSIRERRRALRLTQTGLARQADVPTHFVRTIENGFDIPADAHRRILRVLVSGEMDALERAEEIIERGKRHERVPESDRHD
jgi:predicted transcriptional regulator